MRILHINKYNHERDGVGRYMHDVMRLADAHGHATAVFAMHYEKNIVSPWDHFFVSSLETAHAGRGVDALRQFARTFWSYEAYKKTRAIISAFKPDVIHAHNLYTHLSPSVLSAAKDMGIPVVLTAHDYGYISANYGLFDGVAPISPRASWREIIKTKCIKNSALATATVDAIVRLQKSLGMWTRGVTHILTASEAVKQSLIAGGYRASLVQNIPLPSGTYGALQEISFTAPRARRVVFASRFETYKGIDVLMELAARMPDVEMLCIGHGSREQELRACAQKQGNLSLISSLPPKELWQIIASSAAVLMPSLWPEPFGLVALEALALGTPAIVSDRGGLSEIVEHKVSGFVESPQAIDAWERDIRFLLEEGKRPQEMREKAAERGRKVGNPEEHWNRLFTVYSESVQRKEAL